MRIISNNCKCGKPKLKDGKCRDCLNEYAKQWAQKHKLKEKKDNNYLENRNLQYCKNCRRYVTKTFFTWEWEICNKCKWVQEKRCSKCWEMKNHSEFYTRRDTKNEVLYSACILCSVKKWEVKANEQEEILKSHDVPKCKWKKLCSDYTLSELKNWEWEWENFKPQELFCRKNCF
jgi:hypothetical protein